MFRACLDRLLAGGTLRRSTGAADGDREAVQEAIEVCGRCPVRDRCAEWIARAHPQRPPPGVWAGRYQPQPTTRRKKATT
ncbi:WhiB family transcriptional regulator [[Mycobacterium] zoologicum]|uniref:WhiB family transcriptional regulator n=1 Tax=[Mycobacterium] zoologicum TaxID=2872311 RepID=UPI0038B4E6BC